MGEGLARKIGQRESTKPKGVGMAGRKQEIEGLLGFQTDNCLVSQKFRGTALNAEGQTEISFMFICLYLAGN